MTASLIEKSPDGAEFHTFNARDLELHGQTILRQGWRIVAVFEVMVPMTETEYTHGRDVPRSVLRPEARFLCLRGERADLVVSLERQLETLTQELREAKERADTLERSTRRLERQLEERAEVVKNLHHDVESLREGRDAAHQHLRDAQAHHHTLEAQFGAVRAAIGEIALNSIGRAAWSFIEEQNQNPIFFAIRRAGKGSDSPSVPSNVLKKVKKPGTEDAAADAAVAKMSASDLTAHNGLKWLTGLVVVGGALYLGSKILDSRSADLPTPEPVPSP